MGGLGSAFGKAIRKESILSLYEHHRPQMKTGDIIAFSGNTGFSQIIKWGTGSAYSHVGMILKLGLSGGFGDSVMVVESTTETRHQDASPTELIKGVQMNWLSKRMLMYDGAVWWVPLKHPLAPEKQTAVEAWLRDTHNQRVRYDMIQVMGAGLDMFDRVGLGNSEDISQLFCSELATKALKLGGVVASDINASEQTPADVVNFRCLGEPVSIKDNSDPIE
ncbi:MAG: hypothetical protein J7641_00290 [Cyanobacteria bacterium SID2]|nr:hypothetical protein [Cyanobacteria bacterium SID2]MBP0004145.1 hypothetical protein [Cyanobacteria bacterium SBC]